MKKKIINGGYKFDLLEDGEFFAYEAKFEIGGLSIIFSGTWLKDEEKIPATLDVLSCDPVTEENYLNVGWDESHVTAD